MIGEPSAAACLAVALESTLRLLIYVAAKKQDQIDHPSDVWDGGPSLLWKGRRRRMIEKGKGEEKSYVYKKAPRRDKWVKI